MGFVEVFVDAPIEVVEQRDPKGLYKKARAGEIKGAHIRETVGRNLSVLTVASSFRPLEFTGVSAPYEAPESPEIHIRTDKSDVTESVRIITEYLTQNKYI